MKKLRRRMTITRRLGTGKELVAVNEGSPTSGLDQTGETVVLMSMNGKETICPRDLTGAVVADVVVSEVWVTVEMVTVEVVVEIPGPNEYHRATAAVEEAVNRREMDKGGRIKYTE